MSRSHAQLVNEADTEDFADSQEQQQATANGAVDNYPKPLGAAAYHGITGELVNMIDPHTEADPAAVLIQFLIAFGNLMGRAAYFGVGASKHYTNLFGIVVGTSASGKGSALSPVVTIVQAVDEQWAIQSGLTSGEGLIWHVRDEIVTEEALRDPKTKSVTGYQTVVSDRGVSDKRLLIVETEFAAVLRAMERQGNTLSPVIRQGWDTGNLRTLTKHNPAKATGAHISIVGHITPQELQKYLTESESANGFANRFLWVHAKRSKRLPDGGNFGSINWAPILRQLILAKDLAREIGEMSRDDEAGEKWRSVYDRLTAEQPGLLGTVTRRAAPQTLRLSMIYALLDQSSTVGLKHLDAALEVWRYCQDSARFIFGDRIGDLIADQILDALRANPAGMTREEISNTVFSRNKKADEIERGLQVLAQLGLAIMQEEPTGGRRAQRWFATTETQATGAAA